MSTLFFRRMRSPMGGQLDQVSQEPAAWVAGQTNPFWLCPTTNRSAWPIHPESTSFQRTSPGKMGSPAASAEVQRSGREAFDQRFHFSPLGALQEPSEFREAWKSS